MSRAAERSVVLTGLPGSGKSTVGQILAVRLGLPWYDTDREIERTSGRSIGRIFEHDGEPAFRQFEHDVVLALLGHGPSVVSLGGGAWLDPDVRERCLRADVRSVYLSVVPAVAAARLGGDGGRPLLAGDSGARLVQLLSERELLYRLASFIVDTTHCDAGAVAERIEQALDG